MTYAQEGDTLTALYQSIIVEHAKNPRHYGAIEGATHSADGVNRLCGDRLTLYLRLADGRIEDISFEGSGCAISMASASLLTESILGETTADALQTKRQLIDDLVDGDPDRNSAAGPLASLHAVRRFPSRVRCATLAWQALENAIDPESNATPDG